MTHDDRPPRTDAPRRKVRDAAAVLPVVGVLLLLTPLVSLFTGLGAGGVQPVPFFYIFGIWAVLIVLAFLLSRHLTRADDDEGGQR